MHWRLYLTCIIVGLLATLALVLQLPGCSGNVPQRPTTWASLDTATQYVGQKACRSCHQEVYDSYIHTGMGRSWYRPKTTEKIEDFGPKAIVFDAEKNFYYRPYWQGGKLYIQEYRLQGTDTVHSRTEPVDYIVGSGYQTRSYLLLRSGYLYEAPITWYSAQKKWDLSPGYQEGNNSRFDRALGTECVHCHNAYTEHLPGSINQYETIPLGIDCERCHGPGATHVALMETGDEVDVGREADYSIVNPKRLSVDRQMDVCQQCHLQGVMVPAGRQFRPGMALTDAMHIFLPRQADANSFGIASHAARLRQSMCFVQSKDKMTCTTCHNPHKSVVGTPATFYRKVCESCHSTARQSCTLPLPQREAKGNDCAGCHMPRGGTSDIPHVSFTDHHIRVVKAEPVTTTLQDDGKAQARALELMCATTTKPSNDLLGKAYLLYYEQQGNALLASLLPRALDLLADTSHLYRARAYFYMGQYGRASTEAAKASGPWARYWQAAAQEQAQAYRQAAEGYGSLYKDYPHLADVGLKAALMPLQMPGVQQADVEKSYQLLREILAKKPHDKQVLCNLGFVEMGLNKYKEAEGHLKAALALDPDYGKAVENLILLYHFTDKIPQRDRMLERLKKLPGQQATIDKLSLFLRNARSARR